MLDLFVPLTLYRVLPFSSIQPALSPCCSLHYRGKQILDMCSASIYVRVMLLAFQKILCYFVGPWHCLLSQWLAKELLDHTTFSRGSARQQQTRTLVSWRLREARAICLASFRASIRMTANSNSSCPRGGG